jgi:hypothetical protein
VRADVHFSECTRKDGCSATVLPTAPRSIPMQTCILVAAVYGAMNEDGR